MTDTKDRITPMAFHPDPTLLNTPLARPWRRGLAMLVDLTVIAFFTSLLDEYIVLILFLVLMFKAQWIQQYINRLGKYKTYLLRGAGLIIVIMALLSNFDSIVGNNTSETGAGSDRSTLEQLVGAVVVGKSAMMGQECETAQCWQPYIEGMVSGVYLNSDITSQQFDEQGNIDTTSLVEGLVEDLVEDSPMSPEEIDKLKAMFSDEVKALELNKNRTELVPEPAQPQEPSHLPTEQKSSPLAWLSGLLNDLGLGFGMSAVYFSCFTAWYHGQTIGKMLLNIQVIQLNNTPISLWDAFGRYGGYGAGLATGLLGFVQIYWDFNRQAIQDKIAATVVIDLNLKNREFTQNNSLQPEPCPAVKK